MLDTGQQMKPKEFGHFSHITWTVLPVEFHDKITIYELEGFGRLRTCPAAPKAVVVLAVEFTDHCNYPTGQFLDPEDIHIVPIDWY